MEALRKSDQHSAFTAAFQAKKRTVPALVGQTTHFACGLQPRILFVDGTSAKVELPGHTQPATVGTEITPVHLADRTLYFQLEGDKLHYTCTRE